MKLTEKDKLKELIKDRLIKIAVYMETTMGLPHYLTFEKIEEMQSLLEQLIFINSFAKKHPKAIKPINYSDIL